MAAVLKEPGDADLLDEILKELSVDEEDNEEEGTKNKTISEDAIFYRDREPFHLIPKGAVKDHSEASVLDDTTANKVFNCKIIVPLSLWLLLQFFIFLATTVQSSSACCCPNQRISNSSSQKRG